MTRSSERERIRLLREAFHDGSDTATRVAIGDDAAVLFRPSADVAWSIDAAVDGVHFRRDLMSLEDAAFRATMAALSDLAAMGARPLGVLAALTLPDAVEDHDLLEIARGQRDAARESGTAVVGGNLARGAVLTITTTVLGSVSGSVLRTGATAGDVVALAGPVGLASAGLAAAARPDLTGDGALGAALDAFRRPRARIAEGLEAKDGGATSMIDVSDGLGADVAQIADAAALSIELDVDALVEPALRAAAQTLGLDALELALGGGEDYALIATFSPDVRIPGSFRVIGRCAARAAEAVVLVDAAGTRRAIRPRGFDHFSSERR